MSEHIATSRTLTYDQEFEIRKQHELKKLNEQDKVFLSRYDQETTVNELLDEGIELETITDSLEEDNTTYWARIKEIVTDKRFWKGQLTPYVFANNNMRHAFWDIDEKTDLGKATLAAAHIHVCAWMFAAAFEPAYMLAPFATNYLALKHQTGLQEKEIQKNISIRSLPVNEQKKKPLVKDVSSQRFEDAVTRTTQTYQRRYSSKLEDLLTNRYGDIQEYIHPAYNLETHRKSQRTYETQKHISLMTLYKQKTG